jgi:hypothetical protein
MGVNKMYCAKCGKEMDDNAKFCPACGADAGGDPAAYTPASFDSSNSNSFAAEEPQSSGTGVGAMVCGIIGIILCWVPIVGLVLGIVATVLGSKRNSLPADKRGMATAGFVLGIITLVIGIIMVILLIVAAVVAASFLGSFGHVFGWL